MLSLLRSVYTQRRRLIVGVLSLLFLALIYERDYPVFEGAHIALVIATFVILSIVLVIPMIVGMFIVPSMRSLIELWAIMLVFPAGLGALFPAAADMIVATGFAGLIWFICFMIIYFFLYGHLGDHLPCWFSYRGKASFKTSASPQRIMDAIIPSPDTSKYYTGSLDYLGPDPNEDDSFNVRYSRGDGLYEMQRITYLETEDRNHQRYYFIGDVSAKNADFAEGIMDVKVTPLKNGKNRVVITEEYPNARLRSALWLWFNDEVRETANSVQAQLDGKRDLSFTGRYWRKVAQLS